MDPAKASGEAGDRPAEWTLIKLHTVSAPGAQVKRGKQTQRQREKAGEGATHTDMDCHQGMEESPAAVKMEQEAGRKLRVSEI